MTENAVYDNPLVTRYASREMARLWSAQTKISTWRRLWVALAEAQKELGLTAEHSEGSPIQGAMVMGVSFGVGSLVPILPYLLLPVRTAIFGSVVATGLVLFGIGVLKSRWTHRDWMRSGLEILALGAFAGIAGYLFGGVLPGLIGA